MLKVNEERGRGWSIFKKLYLRQGCSRMASWELWMLPTKAVYAEYFSLCDNHVEFPYIRYGGSRYSMVE